MPSINHQSLTAEIFGITSALLFLSSLAVTLRLISRRLSSASFWWDDGTIVAALILYYGLTACYWVQALAGGLGRHTETVDGPVGQHMLVKFFQSFMAIQIMYYSTSVTFKTSLILLYYRLFGVVRWFRTILIFAEITVACYFFVCLFVAIFECKPVSFYWNKNISGGSCINQTAFYRWNGVGNLLIDLMILSLTFPMVWRLQISFRQKLTLSGIFALGGFVFITSVIRVTSFEYRNPNDESYTGVAPALWTEAEQSLGILCACLPCLRPLFGRLLFGSTQNTTGGTSGRRDIQVKKLSAKGSLEGSRAAGFTRLPEENFQSRVMTNAITAPPYHDSELGPETIMRSQSVEISYDNAERGYVNRLQEH